MGWTTQPLWTAQQNHFVVQHWPFKIFVRQPFHNSAHTIMISKSWIGTTAYILIPVNIISLPVECLRKCQLEQLSIKRLVFSWEIFGCRKVHVLSPPPPPHWKMEIVGGAECVCIIFVCEYLSVLYVTLHIPTSGFHHKFFIYSPHTPCLDTN